MKTQNENQVSDSNCNNYTWNSPRDLEKRVWELEIGGRIETIQTTALLKSARILRKAKETKTIPIKTGMKNNLQGVKN